MKRIKSFYYLFILLFIFHEKSHANALSSLDNSPSSFLFSFTSNSDTLIARKKWVTTPYIGLMKADSISLKL